MDEQSGPRERAPRRRVAIPGTGQTTTAVFRLTLRNLSVTGALAEGDPVPPVGRDLMIEAGSIELFARVVWSEEGRCGLSFEAPLPTGLVASLARFVPSPDAEKAELIAAAREWANPEGRSAFLD